MQAHPPILASLRKTVTVSKQDPALTIRLSTVSLLGDRQGARLSLRLLG